MREGRDVVRMRWWCIRKHDQGWSGNKIAAHLQIPRSTAYYWIAKYGRCRKEEMANKPNKLMMVVDDRTRKFVLRLREKHDWGPCRIERHISINHLSCRGESFLYTHVASKHERDELGDHQDVLSSM